MTRPQVEVGGKIEAVGLAWMLQSVADVRLIGHAGGTKGQSSWLAVAREPGFALAILTNHNYGGVVTDRVADAAYETFLGVRQPELEPVDIDPAPYLGRYEARMADVELVQSDGVLELRYVPKGGFPTPETPPMPPPPPASVKFSSEDELFAVDDLWKGERIRILRDADGGIAWMRVGGRVFKPVES
jgi:hypothetical protein